MKTERPHIAGGRPNNALRPPADNRTTEYNAHIVPRGDAPKTPQRRSNRGRSRPRYAARFLKRRVVSVTVFR